jgi:hypothetical protein
MKYVHFGVMAPDGTERECLVSYDVPAELLILGQLIGRCIVKGIIHTISLNYKDVASYASVYTREGFMLLLKN